MVANDIGPLAGRPTPAISGISAGRIVISDMVLLHRQRRTRQEGEQCDAAAAVAPKRRANHGEEASQLDSDALAVLR